MGANWTDEELAALREHYHNHGPSWDGWSELLPGRNKDAIAVMAHRIGVVTRRQRRHPWTEDEERVIIACVMRASKSVGCSPLATVKHAEYIIRKAMAHAKSGGRNVR